VRGIRRAVAAALARGVTVFSVAAGAVVVGTVLDTEVMARVHPAVDSTGWLWARWGVSVGVAVLLACLWGVYVLRRGRRFVRATLPLVLVAVAVIAPIVYAAKKAHDPKPVPHEDIGPVTHLDVLVVARRTLESTVDGHPPLLDRSVWDTRWSVVVLDNAPRLMLDASPQGDDVLRALTGQLPARLGHPQWRGESRHVLLLDPHSVPSVIDGGGILSAGTLPDAPDAFARRATKLGPPQSTVVLLLRAHDPATAAARWTAWAHAHRIRLVLQGAHGADTITDMASRAVVESADDSDLAALAMRFRPFLRFDSAAQAREGSGFTPINVDDFFAVDQPKMCRSTGGACRRITDATQLDGSYDFLDTGATRSSHTGTPPRAIQTPPSATTTQIAPLPRVPSPTPQPPINVPLPSAKDCASLPPGIPPPPTCSMRAPLYWFARRHGGDVYIGYWWFFPFNPTPVFRRGSCHPLLGIPERECFDHASDWEGVTVVVKGGRDPRPLAVIYEQHGAPMRRSWTWLERRWGDALQDQRALVYVAAGSHSSYPEPCRATPDHYCDQAPLHPHRPDGPHDGARDWEVNADSACAACLQRLPVTAAGKPATWNAFPGYWGRRACILRNSFCAQTTAPRSPGTTDRFLHPWQTHTG
jgi:hypothetical protein